MIILAWIIIFSGIIACIGLSIWRIRLENRYLRAYEESVRKQKDESKDILEDVLEDEDF